MLFKKSPLIGVGIEIPIGSYWCSFQLQALSKLIDCEFKITNPLTKIKRLIARSGITCGIQLEPPLRSSAIFKK